MVTIGFLELNSIAKGIEAADAMCKAASVTLLEARPSCPGKYHILITGEVSAVQSSIKAGNLTGSGFVIDELVIPRIHPEVVAAINMSCMPENPQSIGVLEFFSVTGSILAADAAVKSANVHLIELRLGTGIGGKSFVTLTGDVSAVKTAIENGANTAKDSGLLVNTAVIAHPDKALLKTLY